MRLFQLLSMLAPICRKVKLVINVYTSKLLTWNSLKAIVLHIYDFSTFIKYFIYILIGSWDLLSIGTLQEVDI